MFSLISVLFKMESEKENNNNNANANDSDQESLRVPKLKIKQEPDDEFKVRLSLFNMLTEFFLYMIIWVFFVHNLSRILCY